MTKKHPLEVSVPFPLSFLTVGAHTFAVHTHLQGLRRIKKTTQKKAQEMWAQVVINSRFSHLLISDVLHKIDTVINTS